MINIATAALIEGDYRYWLVRVWDGGLPMLGWVMLNPSTADHTVNDPTIRRCIRFATERGYGGIVVCNLMAYRATNPNELPVLTAHAVGPHNHIHLGAQMAGLDVVCAWGAHRRAERTVAVAVAMKRAKRLLCLGRTADGSPRHPLYVKADTPFEEFPA
jgi:hypothetical protein